MLAAAASVVVDGVAVAVIAAAVASDVRVADGESQLLLMLLLLSSLPWLLSSLLFKGVCATKLIVIDHGQQQ